MCPSEPNKQGRTLLASSLDAADDKRVAGSRHVLDRSPPGRTFLSLWQCFITLGPLLGGGVTYWRSAPPSSSRPHLSRDDREETAPIHWWVLLSFRRPLLFPAC